jgi:hypothetical protein
MITTINGRRVTLDYVNPPIPIRDFDWCAHFAANDIGDPQGYGPTRQAALDDLAEKIEVES